MSEIRPTTCDVLARESWGFLSIQMEDEMSDGKCPKCQSMIDEVRTQKQLLGNPPNAVSGFIVTCPHCETIMGFLPNPERIAQAVTQELSPKPSSVQHFTFKDPEA
jgi:hypothetical protein